MIELIMNYYFELLAWLADPRNLPIALAFLIVEFCVLYWVYYRFNQNKVLKIVLGTLFQPQNFIFNMIGMTIIGLGDIPKEPACTPRAKRWKVEYLDNSGKFIIWPAPLWMMYWRNLFSTTVCNILNKADPAHC